MSDIAIELSPTAAFLVVEKKFNIKKYLGT